MGRMIISGKVKDVSEFIDRLTIQYYGWTLEKFIESGEKDKVAKLLKNSGVKLS